MTDKRSGAPEEAVEYVKQHFPASVDMNKKQFKKFVKTAMKEEKKQKGSAAALAQKPPTWE